MRSRFSTHSNHAPAGASGWSRISFQVVADSLAGNEEVLREIEGSINNIGYGYVGSDELTRALEVFEVNTMLFPGSANTWDSLAETHLALGNRDRSIELYRKALEVDPSFDNARVQLERILSGN